MLITWGGSCFFGSARNPRINDSMTMLLENLYKLRRSSQVSCFSMMNDESVLTKPNGQPLNFWGSHILWKKLKLKLLFHGQVGE